jgi:imidazolonepropionase-like amidohydrolase
MTLPLAILALPLLSTPFAASPPTGSPATETLWIQADRIIVRPGEELRGAVLVQNGVIVAVGPGVGAPEGARELRGAVVCAGYLDAWSSLGVFAETVEDSRTSPATRAVDGIDTFTSDHLRRESLAAGVTSARVQSGVDSVFGGTCAVVHNDPAADGADIALLEDACVAATIGVTRGNRTPDVFQRIDEVDKLVSQIEAGQSYAASLRDYADERAEWEKTVAEKLVELEKDFKKAKKSRDEDKQEAEEKDKEFKEKRYKEDKKPKPPRVDADKAVLARVASGELPLVVEIHRAPEIRALLEKTAAFDRMRLILAGATEAATFAEELAKRGIAVIVWPAPMGRPRSSEYREQDLELAAKLHDAGVEVLFGSGGAEGARDLPTLAALAVGYGLDRTAALRALTLGPATRFDLAGRIGSVERGKQADLLVLSGDPLDVSTRAQYVILSGQVVVEP